MHMKQNLAALATGILFGLGLALAQMIDRNRVLNFLDIAGAWDPTLLAVLGGAAGVTLLTFRIVLRWRRPLLAPAFVTPLRQTVDSPLVLGSALFGIGWGISGFCPGPGIAAFVIDWRNPLLFVTAFVGGLLLHQWWEQTAAPWLRAGSLAETGSAPAASSSSGACG